MRVMAQSKVTFNNFYKTKTCPWFRRGECHWEGACNYAHAAEEKRAAVDLTKTRLCHSLDTDRPCMDPKCRYAHSVSELRATSDVYKTAVCAYKLRGEDCPLGDKCRFAHSLTELRKPAHKPTNPTDNLTTLGNDSKSFPPLMNNGKQHNGKQQNVKLNASKAALSKCMPTKSQIPKQQTVKAHVGKPYLNKVSMQKVDGISEILRGEEDRNKREIFADYDHVDYDHINYDHGDYGEVSYDHGDMVGIWDKTVDNGAIDWGSVNNVRSPHTQSPKKVLPLESQLGNKQFNSKGPNTQSLAPPVAKVVIPSQKGDILLDKTYDFPKTVAKTKRPTVSLENHMSPLDTRGESRGTTSVESFVSLLNTRSEHSLLPEPSFTKNAMISLLNCLTVTEASGPNKGHSAGMGSFPSPLMNPESTWPTSPCPYGISGDGGISKHMTPRTDTQCTVGTTGSSPSDDPDYRRHGQSPELEESKSVDDLISSIMAHVSHNASGKGRHAHHNGNHAHDHETNMNSTSPAGVSNNLIQYLLDIPHDSTP